MLKIEGIQMNKLTADGWCGHYIIDMDHSKVYIGISCDSENECNEVYKQFLIDFQKHDKEALEGALYNRFKGYYYIETDYDRKPYFFFNGSCCISFLLYEYGEYEDMLEDLNL
ncbi:MAG: hypothetical protein L6U99_03065 [Clostridium sp.]|nr:MAG: hypothetical protein L6U99_03065 [Clostridium sp.]